MFLLMAAVAAILSVSPAAAQADPRGNVILGNGDRPKKEKTPTSRSLKGKVTDASGKPLDNAVVTLTNEDTHISLTFFTKQGGQYYFDDLKFTTDYKLVAQYKDGKSAVRTLSQYDHQPNIVRILEVDQPGSAEPPADTAQKKQ
jgi:Carboxypeptidase regulatory-like domain